MDWDFSTLWLISVAHYVWHTLRELQWHSYQLLKLLEVGWGSQIYSCNPPYMYYPLACMRSEGFCSWVCLQQFCNQEIARLQKNIHVSLCSRPFWKPCMRIIKRFNSMAPTLLCRGLQQYATPLLICSLW